MNKTLIYTVITNNYDGLKEIPDIAYRPDQADYICITDSKDLKSSRYEILQVPLIKDDPLLTQKFYKITIGELFESYDHSIYIDGKISLRQNILSQINELNNWDTIGFKHPKRICLYKEAKHVLHPYKRLESKENLKNYIQDIKNEGFPQDYGLTDCSILIRKHNQKINNALSDWYNIVANYSKRDQLSFMYVLWKHKVQIKLLSQQDYSYYASVMNHQKSRPMHGLEVNSYSSNGQLRTVADFNTLNSAIQSIREGRKYGDWIECFHPYENKVYYYNTVNRQCKWDLSSDSSDIYDKI